MQRSDLSRLTGWRMAGIAVLCGAAMALAQAPFGLIPTVFLAVPVLYLLAQNRSWKGRFSIGWGAGLGYFALSLHWIVEPFLVDIARHGWMAPFALILKSGGHALFWGLGFALMRPAMPLLTLVAGWTLAEYLRSTALTGFPWALIGYGWLETPVVQLASISGPHLLGALTVLAAALPALTPRIWQGIAAAALVVAAAGTFGTLRTQSIAPTTDTTIRIVQPNAEQHLKWQPEMLQVFFDRLRRLTRETGDVDAVIWPEVAVPYLIDERLDLNAAIAADTTGRLILGARRVEREPTRWHNSLAALNADGTIAALYDKHHLVPFGEFLPFPGVWDTFGLRALAQQAGQFASGPGPSLIDLPDLPPFQPLICYEIIFPHEMLRTTRPDWLVHITNDAWFGTFSGPYQHLAQTRMRAIETGLPVARAANTGVSAMIDPFGRITASLPLGAEGVLDAVLPAALPRTLYTRTGDWPLAALALILAAGWLLRRGTASR